ncbi:hypothetical protein MYOV003v1_p0223 [Vibrio phage 207E48.1]|nr:hypothetical protein MYOV003v1_p0223 [Vibrio phage 207E48.1]
MLKVPNILKFKPSVDESDRMSAEPLLAKDTGWFAKSSDKDIDCPLVEYNLDGGFLGLLATHGMKLDGTSVVAADIDVFDFSDTANTNSGITTVDETGGAGSFATIATTDLTAGEVAGRVATTSNDIDLDNSEMLVVGYKCAASTTLTFTGLPVGERVGVVLAIEGSCKVSGKALDHTGVIGVTFIATSSVDIVISDAANAVVLGAKVVKMA